MRRICVTVIQKVIVVRRSRPSEVVGPIVEIVSSGSVVVVVEVVVSGVVVVSIFGAV